MSKINVDAVKIQAGTRPYEERLKGWTKTNSKEFRAYCPWHEQDGKHNPSLAVYREDDGSWSYRCMTKCSDKHGDVIGFVMAKDNVKFREALPLLGYTTEKSDAGQQYEKFEYNEKEAVAALQTNLQALAYLDKRGIPASLAREKRLGLVEYPTIGTMLSIPYGDGVVKFRAVADVPDGKKWRHLEGKPSAHLLYNTSVFDSGEFKVDPHVFVVESELDCLTMTAQGYNSVSVSSATACLRNGELVLDENHLAKLQSAERIYLACDQDHAGNQCATAFEKVLPFYKACRVSWDYQKTDAPKVLGDVVGVPGNPKDVGELYVQHRDDFPNLIEELSTKAITDARAPKLFRYAHKPSELSDKPIEWAIDLMYPMHSVALTCGREGVGKGINALLSLAAMHNAGTFLGHKANPVPHILYVDMENPEAVVRQRLEKLGLIESDNFMIWGQWDQTPPPTNFDDPMYREYAEKTGGFIFFDSLIDFCNGADENNAAEMNEALTKARMLARHCAGVHIQHHSDKYGKSGWRGTTAITAAVDMAFGLRAVDDEAFRKGTNRDVVFSTLKPKMVEPFQIKYVVTGWDGELAYRILPDGGGKAADPEPGKIPGVKPPTKLETALAIGRRLIQSRLEREQPVTVGDVKQELAKHVYTQTVVRDAVRILRAQFKTHEAEGGDRTVWFVPVEPELAGVGASEDAPAF